MVTDGGGWVLIGQRHAGMDLGRSRSGRNERRQQPHRTHAGGIALEQVNGLLNGATVASLTDGVRLRRAANPTGTSFQEVRMFLGQQGAWQWGMHERLPRDQPRGERHPVGSLGTTRDTFGDNGLDTKLGVAGNGRNDATRI